MSKEMRVAVRAVVLLVFLGVLVFGADPALLWVVVFAGVTGTWTLWTVYATWMFLVSLVCTAALIRYLFVQVPETSPGGSTK